MAEKVFGRKCEICRRDNFDDRTLGPLIHANNISAHFNCVLYSPVTPDETSLAPKPEDDAIAGLSTRFVRDEGKRAKKLTCNFCKRIGAHIGCCQDIGNDSVVRFCPKKYHIDCGLKAGASFSISGDRGTVSICYEHRDPIERANEQPNVPMIDENGNEDEAHHEYDIGEESIAAIELEGHATIDENVAEDVPECDIGEDPLGMDIKPEPHGAIDVNVAEDGQEHDAGEELPGNSAKDAGALDVNVAEDDQERDAGEELPGNSAEDASVQEHESQASPPDCHAVHEQLISLEIEQANGAAALIKEESFDLALMGSSLDISNDSDCVVVLEYIQEIQK